jgi:hypothetical protein
VQGSPLHAELQVSSRVSNLTALSVGVNGDMAMPCGCAVAFGGQ